jgi:hypothetical protein
MAVTRTVSSNGLQRTPRLWGPAGCALALITAALIYWQTSSIWLAVFGCLMVSRFVIGCMPMIVGRPDWLSRTGFYLLWPVGGSLILYLGYQRSGMMWFAVVLGLVGGAFFSAILGVIFFRRINDEGTRRVETAIDAREKSRAVSRAISRFGANRR